MGNAKVWQEKVTFKTYLTGKQDTHPIFLEHRVYQGSSGSVYPYGVTDTLLDKSEDREYNALFIENDFIKVMILPELGGRVHRAYDKVNQRDFVYFNHVIKPALVGLLGPWISGGIEFNWPQHHRPTTYMPLDYSIKTNEDGSATVFVGEREPMHGLTITTAFTLFKDKALLQIKSKIYNGNDTPRSFLWWSNPAVKGGDGHQSVFPPDVTAVFDHGKRAVIDFPIAHGEYYKVKYDGVDISRYKNLPVPTSYMAWRSDYDFVGAYCHDEDGGLLHVADHHVSPGKKQWSWGYGDFGQAWDRNLTDNDGPYIELMTGVYTDNQPDFTWLDPGEEKEFIQNFLPYSKLGTIQNASEKAAIKLERDGTQLRIGVYAIEAIKGKAIITTKDGKEIYQKDIDLTPCKADLFNTVLQDTKQRLILKLIDNDNNVLVEYLEHEAQPTPLPEIAKNPPFPHEVTSTDEAYFIGQHLEQYHHATRNNFDYYLRGIEIDPLDYRCNLALGNFEYNRCNYVKALEYAQNALKRAHNLNRNPACGLASVLKANCLLKMQEKDKAFDEFFRATWSYNSRTKGYIGLSQISAQKHDFIKAFEFANRALETEVYNQDALALKIYSAFEANLDCAITLLNDAITNYPLNPLLYYFKAHYLQQSQDKEQLNFALNNREINFISVAEFLFKVAREDLAYGFLNHHRPCGAIANLIFASLIEDKNLRKEIINKSESEFNAFVRFPNLIFERDVLDKIKDSDFALHLCASFDYSHRLYDKAAKLWQECLKLNPQNAEAWRGLGIYYFNKCHDNEEALRAFKEALKCSNGDERILFELDLLLKLTKHSPQERLDLLSSYNAEKCLRDDLKAETLTLLNQQGQVDKAYALLSDRTFHVWEGGEGRVTGQYINNALLRAAQKARNNDFADALTIVEEALTFPHNLGEGKLIGQTDNDLYFFGAYYAHKSHDNDKSKRYLKLATRGLTSISEQRYYNDTPCDYVFYNAFAHLILGDKTKASQIFKTMQQWSYNSFNEQVVEDFFAVSLPDLVVLDRNLNNERQENCLVMRMLSSIGLNDKESFEKSASDLEALQPSNYKLSLYKALAPILFDIVNQGCFN